MITKTKIATKVGKSYIYCYGQCYTKIEFFLALAMNKQATAIIAHEAIYETREYADSYFIETIHMHVEVCMS